MSSPEPRAFIGLAAPHDLAEKIRLIAPGYTPSAPPHITLQKPFHWDEEWISGLTGLLKKFDGWPSCPVTLSQITMFRDDILVALAEGDEIYRIHTELQKLLRHIWPDSSPNFMNEFTPHLTLVRGAVFRSDPLHIKDNAAHLLNPGTWNFSRMCLWKKPALQHRYELVYETGLRQSP